MLYRKKKKTRGERRDREENVQKIKVETTKENSFSQNVPIEIQDKIYMLVFFSPSSVCKGVFKLLLTSGAPQGP